MTSKETVSRRGAPPRDRFIPVRKTDLLNYFRNINNAGVLETIIGSAEEQACKEAFLAFYFLARAAAPIARSELERRIKQWLSDKFAIRATLEIGETVAKLERLALLRRNGDKLAVPSLDEALDVLGRAWAGFFPATKAQV
jgi:hypothetical protein